MADRFAAARAGRRRGALRGLRAVPVPRVGAEEPDAVAVRRARAPRLRDGDRLRAPFDVGPSASSTPAPTAPDRARAVPAGAAADDRGRAVDGRDFAEVDRLDVDGELRALGGGGRAASSTRLPVSRSPRSTHRHRDRRGSDAVEDLERRSAAGELVGRIAPPARAGRPDRGARRGTTGPTPWACSSRSSSTSRTSPTGRVRCAGATSPCRHSLVAVHTLLAVDDGAFVSLLDPPDDARGRGRRLLKRRHVPGARSATTTPSMLSSPIILYDHPEVAPESDGDLYDATEIDEILALRVLTLTDDEKAEARAHRPRAAAIVDRIDDMAPDMWARLHGTMRELRTPASAPSRADDEAPLPWWEPAVDAAVDPWTDTVVVAGVEVAHGQRACGCARRGAPTRTTCSSTAWSRRSPACSTTSTARCTWRSPSTTTPRRKRSLAHGRYLFFHSRRGRAARCSRWRDDEPSARRRHRQHLPQRRRLRRGSRATAAAPPDARRACASTTSASAACTSRTSCSTATSRWCSSTRCPMGEAPGTVALLEPEIAPTSTTGDDAAPMLEAHSMSPAVVLDMLAGLGGARRPHPHRRVRACVGRGGHRPVRRRRRLGRPRRRSVSTTCSPRSVAPTCPNGDQQERSVID